MPRGIPFNNPAADARIIEMWNAGQVPREIADDLGLTLRAVKSRIDVMRAKGLPLASRYDGASVSEQAGRDTLRAREVYDAGGTPQEAMKQIEGRSIQWFYRRWKAFDLDTYHNVPDKPERLQRRARKCLSCHVQFMSAHCGERMCPNCKNREVGFMGAY